MKPSKYTFIFPFTEDESKHVIYNSRTNALALIENENLTAFKQYCLTGHALDDELKNNLIAGGFLLDDDVDEKQSLRYNMLRQRYNTSTLTLTIVPTADCNFRCSYCYEKKSIQELDMSEHVQERLVGFVRQQASVISTLSITWYGGEPMLALDTIESLTGKFKKICEEFNVRFYAAIVTNGYLLTEENIKILKLLDIRSIQITLDGPPEVHNKRRHLADGSPTFDRIIENLKAAKGLLSCSVAVRINTDKKNSERVDEVISILEENGLLDFVNPYLGYVQNSNDTYSNMLCLPLGEFAETDLVFKQRMSKHNDQLLLSSYPHLRGCFCSADSLNSYVVNADGSLCKCWNDVGIAGKRTASLIEGEQINPSSLFEYMLYDPTDEEECAECKYLPICMGGCPSRRLENSEGRCDIMKYKMSDYMKILPKLLRERNHREATGSASGTEG